MARKYRFHTYYCVVYEYYIFGVDTTKYDIIYELTLREARKVAKYIAKKQTTISVHVMRRIWSYHYRDVIPSEKV